jgi:precorrin-6B methylase 2
MCRNDLIVEYGAAHAKVTVCMSILAGFALKVVGFERDARQFECSQKVLQEAHRLVQEALPALADEAPGCAMEVKLTWCHTYR